MIDNPEERSEDRAPAFVDVPGPASVRSPRHGPGGVDAPEAGRWSDVEARTTVVTQDEETETLPLSHADRLAQDAVLCAEFRRTRCTGALWDAWVERLVLSTRKLLIAWCKRGLIFKKTQATPWPRHGSFLNWDPTELMSLVNEIQARALKLLRDKGINGGKWNPDLGATLHGYFLGGCVRVFADRWRTWARHHEYWSKLEMHEDILKYGDQPLDDFTGYEFDAKSLLGLLQRKLTHKQYEVLAASSEEYTIAEMSEIFGVPENTISKRLERGRRTAKLYIDEAENG